MNYQELMDVLNNRKAAFNNMQPTAIQVPTLEQVISGIQSQYQQPMIPQAQVGQSYGAARFTGGPQTFSQQEFTPAVASVPKFVPGAFDINKYTAKTDVNDIASMINSYGGNSGFNTGSGSESPLPNSNTESWGIPLSLGTIGKGAMAMLSMSPVSMISAFLSGKQDMANGTYGQTVTNADGSKTISGYIQGQPFSYTEAPSGSVNSDPMGYGVSPTSIGPPAAQQAQEQMQSLIDSLNGYSSYSSDTSQSYGGGNTTSQSSADSTAFDNSGTGGY